MDLEIFFIHSCVCNDGEKQDWRMSRCTDIGFREFSRISITKCCCNGYNGDYVIYVRILCEWMDGFREMCII